MSFNARVVATRSTGASTGQDRDAEFPGTGAEVRRGVLLDDHLLDKINAA